MVLSGETSSVPSAVSALVQISAGSVGCDAGGKVTGFAQPWNTAGLPQNWNTSPGTKKWELAIAQARKSKLFS